MTADSARQDDADPAEPDQAPPPEEEASAGTAVEQLRRAGNDMPALLMLFCTSGGFTSILNGGQNQ